MKRAIVVEEDRYLVLSARAQTPEHGEHPVRVMTDAHDARPEDLGSVVVRGNELLAIVIDLDSVSRCELESVETAVRRVLEIAVEEQIDMIGIPLLGTKHGGLDPDEVADAINRIVAAHSAPYPSQVLTID